MKKLILSLSLIVVFAFYAFWSSSRSNVVATTSTTNTKDLNVSPSVSPVASNIPSTSSTTQPKSSGSPVATIASTPVAATNSGKYKNGVYTGPASDVYYGNVQVKATIANGQLTDIVFLQYPNDRKASQQKSAMAMPILKSEAIKAQSAKVDTVSQATETSKGFIASLSGALAQATN